MSKIFAGRYTAETDEPFVVFLIGMRINKLWAIHKWLPVMMAMNPMMQRLYQDPELGFLGGFTAISNRVTVMVQYWRSFDDLEHFARHPTEPHREAWKRFNQAVGSDGSVGIWHETYQVNPGQFESVYGNMPLWGLASATNHVPATGRRYSARGRLEKQEPQQPIHPSTIP
jgi:hypothetical protein